MTDICDICSSLNRCTCSNRQMNLSYLETRNIQWHMTNICLKMLLCPGSRITPEEKSTYSDSGAVEVNTQQNGKCFELYSPVISEKLSEGFIINHWLAVLPTKRIAWWAAAWDLGVWCCLVWSSSLSHTCSTATLLWGGMYLPLNTHTHMVTCSCDAVLHAKHMTWVLYIDLTSKLYIHIQCFSITGCVAAPCRWGVCTVPTSVCRVWRFVSLRPFVSPHSTSVN